MKFSIIALATLLPLVASSLHPKKLINNNNSVLRDPPRPMWWKGELSCLVRELRLMHMSGGWFSRSSAVKLEKFLMGSEYDAMGFGGYDDLLAERVVTFAAEAEMHGFEIGGAVENCISILNSNGNRQLIPHLIKSDNVEVKAAVVSLKRADSRIWTGHYHNFKIDERVQRRLLELLSFQFINTITSVLLCWKRSLCGKVESIKDFNLMTGFSYRLSVYIKYSLQQRLLSPEEIMIKIVETTDFNKLFTEMMINYKPTETSTEMDIEIVMAIYVSDRDIEIAEKILSNSKFRDLPYEEFKQLEVAARFAKLNSFIREKVFSQDYLGKFSDIDPLKVENVEKLLRSGNAIQYFQFSTRKIKDNLSNDVKYEIGKCSARLLLEISRHPTKYFWTSNSIGDIIELLYQVVSSINLSFDTDNEIVRTLDFAFHGGDLMEYLNRYKQGGPGTFNNMIYFSDSRRLYHREVAFFVILKKYLGEKDTFLNINLIFVSFSSILKNSEISKISKVECWKRLFVNVAETMNKGPKIIKI